MVHMYESLYVMKKCFPLLPCILASSIAVTVVLDYSYSKYPYYASYEQLVRLVLDLL